MELANRICDTPLGKLGVNNKFSAFCGLFLQLFKYILKIYGFCVKNNASYFTQMHRFREKQIETLFAHCVAIVTYDGQYKKKLVNLILAVTIQNYLYL